MQFSGYSNLIIAVKGTGSKATEIRARAGRTLKVAYTVTNPTNEYVSGQNLLVQTVDCVSQWSFPIALEPYKSKTYVVKYTLDKCSDATSAGLESSIAGTAVYGPPVAITITPPTNVSPLCKKRTNTPVKTPKTPKVV